LNTSSIVVVDDDGAVGVVFEEIKVFEDVGRLLESFCAFINGADFGFA